MAPRAKQRGPDEQIISTYPMILRQGFSDATLLSNEFIVGAFN
jgi:hypothetical protein